MERFIISRAKVIWQDLNGYRIKKSKKWYYLRSSGELAVSQMIVTNGNSYYLGKDGAMVTRGEIEWERKSYYVKSDGICGKIKNIIKVIYVKQISSFATLKSCTNYTDCTDLDPD